MTQPIEGANMPPVSPEGGISPVGNNEPIFTAEDKGATSYERFVKEKKAEVAKAASQPKPEQPAQTPEPEAPQVEKEPVNPHAEADKTAKVLANAQNPAQEAVIRAQAEKQGLTFGSVIQRVRNGVQRFGQWVRNWGSARNESPAQTAVNTERPIIGNDMPGSYAALEADRRRQEAEAAKADPRKAELKAKMKGSEPASATPEGEKNSEDPRKGDIRKWLLGKLRHGSVDATPVQKDAAPTPNKAAPEVKTAPAPAIEPKGENKAEPELTPEQKTISEVEKAKQNLTDLEGKISRREEKINNWKAEIESLREDIDKNNQRIQQLEARILGEEKILERNREDLLRKQNTLVKAEERLAKSRGKEASAASTTQETKTKEVTKTWEDKVAEETNRLEQLKDKLWKEFSDLSDKRATMHIAAFESQFGERFRQLQTQRDGNEAITQLGENDQVEESLKNFQELSEYIKAQLEKPKLEEQQRINARIDAGYYNGADNIPSYETLIEQKLIENNRILSNKPKILEVYNNKSKISKEDLDGFKASYENAVKNQMNMSGRSREEVEVSEQFIKRREVFQNGLSSLEKYNQAFNDSELSPNQVLLENLCKVANGEMQLNELQETVQVAEPTVEEQSEAQEAEKAKENPYVKVKELAEQKLKDGNLNEHNKEIAERLVSPLDNAILDLETYFAKIGKEPTTEERKKIAEKANTIDMAVRAAGGLDKISAEQRERLGKLQQDERFPIDDPEGLRAADSLGILSLMIEWAGTSFDLKTDAITNAIGMTANLASKR